MGDVEKKDSQSHVGHGEVGWWKPPLPVSPKAAYASCMDPLDNLM